MLLTLAAVPTSRMNSNTPIFLNHSILFMTRGGAYEALDEGSRLLA